jgi:hypothetical protein
MNLVSTQKTVASLFSAGSFRLGSTMSCDFAFGGESILVYPFAGLMYLGLGVALYAILMFWTDAED